MINGPVFIFAFCVAVLAGAIAATTVARVRPQWSERRRMMVSALLLPAFTLFATLAGLATILVTGPGDGENMQDLALVATAMVGVLFAFLFFIGGMIGAGLRQPGTGK